MPITRQAEQLEKLAMQVNSPHVLPDPLLCIVSPPSKSGTASSHRSSRLSDHSISKANLKKELEAEELALRIEEVQLKRCQLRSQLKSLHESIDEDCLENQLPETSPNSKCEGYLRRIPPEGDWQRCVPKETDRSFPAVSNLPKIELDKFDGNPLKFWKFIRGFDMSVAQHLHQDHQRLLYLVHYCVGPAKEAIEHCVMLSDNVGYRKARDILSSQFGRPHDIVECFMKELLHGVPLSPNDLDGLRQLVRKMTNCELVLTQMNVSSEINCTTNIKRIAQRLPKYLQLQWAEKADDILSDGTEPTFSDLITFLNRRISIASNCYGQIAQGSNFISSRTPENYRENHPKGRVHTITARESEVCPACHDPLHTLDRCSSFLNMTRIERVRLLRRVWCCFNCLGHGHRAVDCKSTAQCTNPGCGRRHHNLLHFAERTSQSGPIMSQVNSVRNEGHACFLGFIPVRIVGPKGSLETYAFLDNGSDATLLLRDAADKVGLEGKPTRLQVSSIGGTVSADSIELSFDIQSTVDDYCLHVDGAYTVDHLPIKRARIPSRETLLEWPHLRDVQLPTSTCDQVSLLIGTNVPEAHWVLEQRIGTSRQPCASLTVMGWVLFGPAFNREKIIGVNCLETTHSIESKILQMMESEYSVPNEPEEKTMSVEDRRVLENTQSRIKLIDGHYEVPLPWKESWRNIPENRSTAEKRLGHLRKRLVKDDDLAKRYDEMIADHEVKGYISRVLDSTVGDRRFIPHHPVLNPSKPNKLRIVFDCAAKTRDVSLNDCLHTGPDLANDLTGVLLRFRCHKIGLAADIEEMFLQVHLSPEDSRPLSFLWHSRRNFHAPPDVYQLNVHPFGATSSPFCATFALRQCAVDFEDEYTKQTIQTVRSNFYVDDCLVSVESVDDGITLTQELRHLVKRGGFRLHKWTSNSQEVLATIPPAERSPDRTYVSQSSNSVQKTLGLCWCVKSDCFLFKVDLPERPNNKRGMLSCAASLYDPLGFVAPLLLQPKYLLQQLCRQNRGWDEPTDEAVTAAWQTWQNGIRKIECLRIPRCLKATESEFDNISLHSFADASEKGFGAVVYLRCHGRSAQVSCRFVMGKSRVAPLKVVTIPRMELQAAVLSVKLTRHVAREIKLNVNDTFYWTDSMIVLHYIMNTKSRFKTFVANRVAFIRENTNVTQWRHVPSQLNPADLASRGIDSNNFQLIHQWLSGPEYLRAEEHQWPTNVIFATPTDYADPEVKREVAVMAIETPVCAVDYLVTYFSSWLKLRRAVAWITRFKGFIRKLPPKSGPLDIHEVVQAERDIIAYVQRQTFGDEIKRFQQERNVSKSPLRKLRPILLSGLLCVGGRLRNCSLHSAQKHPIILPGRHSVTDAIIRHYHEAEGHMGTAHILALLRRKYWIIRGAAAVKRIIHHCLGCRLRSAKPAEQIMSDLPPSRVEPDFPFVDTGVDYFGPLVIREGRSNRKRYGCLFTCLKTRAVHIEVSYSLSIDSFIMAFTRFINRRGSPRAMHSDRGTNFVGVEREMRPVVDAMDGEQMKRLMVNWQIEWRFNPPYSSHRGGAWERLIRCIRRILSATSQEQVLTDEALATYLTEVERILNSRPLVPVYDDPQQLDVLTPNHALLMKVMPLEAGSKVTLRERYTHHWKQGQLMADTFWRRWTREYLPLLQTRGKWTKERRNIQVGDLVLIIGEPQARNEWPKGVVTATVLGNDGLARRASVKTSKGMVDRDIRKLCLLEGVIE